jgi:hypothetical protein
VNPSRTEALEARCAEERFEALIALYELTVRRVLKMTKKEDAEKTRVRKHA